MPGVDLLPVLFKFMDMELLVLIICYVAMLRKMTKNLLSANIKDVAYPLSCIFFGILFGIVIISPAYRVVAMTIGLSGGGVMAVKNWMKGLKNGTTTPPSSNLTP